MCDNLLLAFESIQKIGIDDKLYVALGVFVAFDSIEPHDKQKHNSIKVFIQVLIVSGIETKKSCFILQRKTKKYCFSF